MTDIADLTKDCPREDCRVVYHGSSTTLMGWSQIYDKKGNPVGNDPNTTTSSFTCSACGKRWRIESQPGKADTVEVFKREVSSG